MSEDNTNTSPIVEDRTNPLLAKLRKRIPGESFRLPSRGMFDTSGELDSEVEEGEVVVYPMTTIDELKMRSPDMLFQGSAITEVIAHCVPQVLNPSALIASDVDYILTALRKVSYGPHLPVKHKCQACEAPEKEYNLAIDHFLRGSKELTREKFDSMTITVDDYIVKLKPCIFSEMIKILQRANDSLDSAEKLSELIDTSLAAIIRSVDGVKEKPLILEWLAALPRETKEELSNMVEGINDWGVEFNYDVKCESCGHVNNIKTSLNPVNFFMLPSKPETP